MKETRITLSADTETYLLGIVDMIRSYNRMVIENEYLIDTTEVQSHFDETMECLIRRLGNVIYSNIEESYMTNEIEI